MLKIYGFNSQNNKKVLYIAEELNIPYEFINVNLMERENRSEDFLKMNPVGKVPVIDYKGKILFESGAICRFLADISDSTLFPNDKYERAQVDQWMEFFTNHLGSTLNRLYFEIILKPILGMGQPDKKSCEESQKLVLIQLKILERELVKRSFIVSNELTIADFYAYAYIEQMDGLKMSFENYPSILKWKEEVSRRDSIKSAQRHFN